MNTASISGSSSASEHPKAPIARLVLLTLIAPLRGLRDVDSKLTVEGVDTHHACMYRAVGQAWQLVVCAWNVVESLSDVCCSLQNDLL